MTVYTHPGVDDARPEVEREVDGYVYAMSCSGTRALKFGFTSRTPSARARDGTLTPLKLVVIAQWRLALSDAVELERLVLRRLKHCRTVGEWLSVDLETLRDEVERTAEVHDLAMR